MNTTTDQELDGQWVGKEKSRYDFVLKLIEQKSTTRGYWVYRMKDRHGNMFIAFDGSDSSDPGNVLFDATGITGCSAYHMDSNPNFSAVEAMKAAFTL